MVRIDANFVPLLRERVLAVLDRSQLVVRLQIRPAPKSAVDDVRQTFASYTLDTVVADAARTRPSGQNPDAFD